MNEKILVVNDETNVRKALTEILEDEYVIVTAEEGKEVIEKIEQGKPDLLIFDLKLPEIEGLQIIKKIKEIYPHLPVIVTSAIAEIKTVVEAMRLGAEEYLIKPFHLEELKRAVGQILGKNTTIDLPLEIKMLITELSKKMVEKEAKLEEASQYFEKEFISRYGKLLPLSSFIEVQL